jgi:hypothetical protein
MNEMHYLQFTHDLIDEMSRLNATMREIRDQAREVASKLDELVQIMAEEQ